MESTTAAFRENTSKALGDAKLRDALSKLTDGFPARRREAIARLPEFDALRDAARDIKDHVLANLDFYLETFEARVVEAGGLGPVLDTLTKRAARLWLEIGLFLFGCWILNHCTCLLLPRIVLV